MKLINLNNLMRCDCPRISLLCCFSNCFQSLDMHFPSKQSSPVLSHTRFPLPRHSSKIIILPLFFLSWPQTPFVFLKPINFHTHRATLLTTPFHPSVTNLLQIILLFPQHAPYFPHLKNRSTPLFCQKWSSLPSCQQLFLYPILKWG